MPAPGFIKKTLKLLLVLSIQIIFIALALEVGLRFIADDFIPPGADQPKIWQYHDTYGWVGQPNIDLPFRHPAFTINIKHNDMGQRDQHYSSQRNNKNRILLIGDSFVWGYGVEDKQRFAEIIDDKYHDWEIINAGIAGTGTDQQLLYLQDMIAYYQPDIVMLLVIQNDFQDNMLAENHHYYKPYFTVKDEQLVLNQVPVPKPRFEQTLQRTIYGRSYLFNFSNALVAYLTHLASGVFSFEVEEYRAYRHFKFIDSHPIMKALLHKMIDVSKEHNAEFIMLHGQMLDGLQLVLKEVADQRQVKLHNLDRAFEGHVHEEYQISGDAHWNAFGHELVAKDVELFLQEQAILPRQ